MADNGGVYGSKAADTDFRKKWDKEEYAERAKRKDRDERERMQENEERMRQGKRPRKRRTKGDILKPTELMQAREGPLELDKNLKRVTVVQGLRGLGQPGFHCVKCDRTFMDSVGYLDHVNSRAHLRMLGQTTNIERSTLEQVRERIRVLKERTKEKTTSRNYDFEKRLADIKAEEQARRKQKKADRKAERVRVYLESMQGMDGYNELQQNMGFASFGSKRK